MEDMHNNDSDFEMNSNSFVFSRPNVVNSPDKIFNSAIQSKNIFGGKINNNQDISAFTFAKPAVIENTDYDLQKPDVFISPKKGRIKRSSVSPVKGSQNKKEKSKNPRKSSVSPLTATRSIKKESSYNQLEKNSKKKEPRLMLANSITCTNVPEALLLKAVAKEHFDQFGDTLKIIVKPKRKMIVVYYPTKVVARKAFANAGKFLNKNFKVEWTTAESSNKPKKNETVKGKIASILNLDDDVKEELEAMKGLEYNLHDSQSAWALTKAKVKKAVKIVANKEAPKKTLPLRARNVPKLMQKVVPKVNNDVSKVTKVEKPVQQVDKNLITKIDVPLVHQSIPKISSAAIQEMQNQVCQAATTAEEKYKILDTRDKLMRLKRNKQQSLATAKLTKGTCPDMCPEKERYMREFQRQLSTYEQLDSNDYKLNANFAVKQYSRSSADQEEPMAHDLRPLKSLKMTMSFLLHEIADLCDREDANLTEWYHFLWDRMRSVRKDITQQELCCAETVELVEQCARFHILSSERLCAEETSVFDPKINSENLTKCLQTLKYMYCDLQENEINCKNEPEFRAYVILLNLNNGSFVSELSTLPLSVQHSSEVKLALEFYSTIAMNNYVKFFKLVRKTTYLNGCILMRYFNQVRLQAIKVMIKAYCRASGPTEYPLYELIDILGFEDEEEVFEFCNSVGLEFDRDSLYIKLNKETFHLPQSNIEQGRALNLVLSKRLQSKQSVGQCIAGGILPEKTYENHQPHNSFDNKGYLLKKSRNANDQNLTSDPYEFRDEDNDVEFVSEIKSSGKTSNEIDSKKSTTLEFPYKLKTISTTPVNNDKFHVQNTKATPESLSTNVFGSSLNTVSSIFAKPAAPIFTTIPNKPTELPTNSSFAMAVNKSIFSGNSNANLFMPTTGQTFGSQVNFKSSFVNNITETKPTTSKNDGNNQINVVERTATKRHLDDPKDLAEKKALTEKEELLRKQLELKRKILLEQERTRVLERVNLQSLENYTNLQEEIVKEICSELLREELNRLENESNVIYEKALNDVCEEVLRDQLFIQDTLMEVESRLRERLTMKYYRAWKQWIARRRAHRREALDVTPVWMQPVSLDECAKKLYRPEQRIAIKYAIEQKKRRSQTLVEEENKVTRHTPIEYIVYVGLKENVKLSNVSCQNNFWKMVISWPFLDNRITVWRHKNLINRYLSPSDPTLEPIIIRHKPNSTESLDICVRCFEGYVSKNCIVGMDALLFIVSADENERAIEKRLGKAILSREKLMPIPLVIIVFGDKKRDAKRIKLSLIDDLLESGYVSEYSILYENSVDEDVVLKTFESATLWLTVNRSPPVPLEMNHLQSILDDYLTEELWIRIKNSLSRSTRLSKALNDPNFIINLHNEAITHITDIILDPRSNDYTNFSPELKIYLNKKRTYPCTYEFFDNVWKHSEYKAELERIMNSFIFPPWKDDWPIKDTMDAYDAIIDYCRQVISYNSSISVTNNIMSDLFLITDDDEDNYSSFIDILLHIMAQKINEIGSNTLVVYDKNHIKNFHFLPWWFRSGTLLDYVNEHVEEDKAEEEENYNSTINTRISQQMDYEDFECDIDELNETCKQIDEEKPIEKICEETRAYMIKIETSAKEFEKKIVDQRLRDQEFEKKLSEALKNGQLDDT